MLADSVRAKEITGISERHSQRIEPIIDISIG